MKKKKKKKKKKIILSGASEEGSWFVQGNECSPSGFKDTNFRYYFAVMYLSNVTL